MTSIDRLKEVAEARLRKLQRMESFEAYCDFEGAWTPEVCIELLARLERAERDRDMLFQTCVVNMMRLGAPETKREIRQHLLSLMVAPSDLTSLGKDDG